VRLWETSDLRTSEIIFLLVGIVGFTGIFILLGIMLYAAKTKTGTTLNHLTNSSISSRIIILWHGGPWGRIYMMGETFGMLRNPALYIYQGKSSTKDIQNFPPKLKRTLLTLHRYQKIFGFTFMGFGLLATFKLI
jgi:hypothetical protein